MTKARKRTSPKLPERRNKPPATANPRLTQQTRKILGKHYAAKYRVK
jgi:hypothetical protein